MKKVLIGMSGGVDSTVSALLLQEEGYEVEGVYMRLHSKPGYHEIHQARAQKAADFIGVKLHILDLEEAFKEKVYNPFIESYSHAKTPNPCALCNRNIKFGEMIRFADSLGIEKIATGHYIQCDGDFFYQAEDETKDQSYFLFYVEKRHLPRLIFPLAHRKKEDIKAFASKIQELESFASQSESSEICFVETTYVDLLKEYMNVDQIGNVLDKDGNIVGEHKGFMHYTIGKRRGFTVKGAHDPHFVLRIDAQRNEIVVGTKDDLACEKLKLNNMNMFIDDDEFEAEVKVRYRTKAVKCSVKRNGNGADVVLYESVYGVAPGQAAVFYQNNKLIGGGWIE
ncbi:MAG: tRNA 2-thiouridine(34) synthase MnmA [Epsilonproteobacteria bacterium]|nr:tRNA 2-thiouridine(34) synthase MnmA [Campylobacterota bacterium]